MQRSREFVDCTGPHGEEPASEIAYEIASLSLTYEQLHQHLHDVCVKNGYNVDASR